MPRYASETTVSVEKSRIEIERTLARYGADAFAYFAEANRAMVAFRMADRQIKFVLTLPERNLPEFTHHSRGPRTAEAALTSWEQACRQRWRALALVIKAKLEAVAAGITTIEDEFLAHTLLPDGSTVGEWAKPQLNEAYQLGHMPTTLLLAAPAGEA
ncbi:hypothetical protein [Phenylobacterium sp. SCN 70-31]|uniref:hypothetical protein n=1 Tax=Phenylobacterium sp. SCN 70-31 TaxID=1660129 RepID=UPI00086A07C9|nr:hypothetical protein [Phenylobacterium sp. SCN 70-31]ODT86692.1 MAG: hypothetical protein ABS78_15530 [Phenylobacterium sp. SCN 70-31]